MSEQSLAEIDLNALASKAKAAWMVQAKKSITIQERIAVSIPWWLIIIAGGLFALSAGHTAGVFFQLSPVGYAGPFVVEFSLLWAAFARKAKTGGASISLALRSLEFLAFVTAIAVNGIGAITRIAERTGIANLSSSALMQQFGTLPLGTQFEIIFVPLFALLIPIGTWVAGEGIASLFLTERRAGSVLEQRWREVEREELRRAFYVVFARYLEPMDAKQRADLMSAGLSGGRSRTPRLPHPVSVRALPERASRTSAANMPARRDADARSKVRRHLADHPEDAVMPARQLAAKLGVGKTVAHEEKTRYQSENGHE